MRSKKFSSGCFAVLSGVTLGTYWIAKSQSFPARFIRERFAELGQKIASPHHKPTPGTWNDNALTATWLGHATVLVNFYGVKILTDPVLMSRVGADLRIGTVGPKRAIAPALTVEELPPIDLVLLSHAHLDHFDLPTLRNFRENTKVVTARKTADLLSRTKLKNPHELGWGEKTTVKTQNGDVEIEGIEVNHWGARWQHDAQRGYNGYVISREGKRIIFGGDTAMSDSFRNQRGKGPFELAIMPIGAYNPWIRAHCTPEEAIKMSNDAGARHILPIHHQAFALGREPFKEPIERFQEALSAEPERVALRDVGETFVLN
ncbi:MAG: MBL fold metallo-hydrolase [Verrucomicrobia bacterium]|nr:MBL fold metallo-hydrolase [Verrucomicrobiota bacterium]